MLHLGLAAAGTIPEAVMGGQQDRYWREPAGKAARQSFDRALEGIRLYQLHPYRRQASGRSVWRSGSMRVVHYRPKSKPNGQGIFIIPSMINGTAVLDILPREKSFVRWLAGQGYDVYVLDWADLAADRNLRTLDLALTKKLLPALEWLVKKRGQAVHGIGYCMGGLMLAAAAIHRPKLFATLGFFSTPWDFHAGRGTIIADGLEKGLNDLGNARNMPATWLQAAFAGNDPGQTVRKFSAFAGMDQKGHDARLFTAVEDWLASGSDLPMPIARACHEDFYERNKPWHGSWRIAAKTIDARKIKAPSIVIAPTGDKVVPPGAALALAGLLPKVEVLQPKGGHISMMVGRDAEKTVWRPYASWIEHMASRPLKTKARHA